MTLLYFLDLAGVFVFAAYGAHKAAKAEFDIFGVAACGALTAFGGGTIRELIANGTPVYLYDYSYLLVCLAGIGFAVAVHRRFARFDRHLLIVDAVGVAVFAYIGAHKAAAMQLGLAAMVFFAVLTAAGGGILSDIVSGRRPEALYKDAYPLAPIVLAVIYFCIRPVAHQADVALLLVALAFALRVLSIRLKLRFWQPHRRPVRLWTRWRKASVSTAAD